MPARHDRTAITPVSMRNRHWISFAPGSTMPVMHNEIRFPRIGILGGMGPLATADFLAKLTHATPALRDQDHFLVTVESAPQIPDRVAAWEGRGDDPLRALVAVARRLTDAGCDLIAMPCNTAHLWHEALCRETSVPVLHIADAVALELGGARKIGLLGTPATLASGLYQQRIGQRIGAGCDWLLPTDFEMAAQVLPGVVAIKRGAMAEAAGLLRPAAAALAARGADVIVLGCTEIPLAISANDAPVPVIDATAALARATVAAALRLRAADPRAGTAVRKAA